LKKKENNAPEPSLANLKTKKTMQLAINTVGEELRSSAEYCKKEKIGIELTDLAYPWNLDGDPKTFIEKHIRSIEGITPRICHGPYFELNVVSFDKAIIDVCRQRHRKALDIAKRMGVGTYVTHTNFNPLIRQPSYREMFVDRLLEFWLSFADDAAKSNIVIVFENHWESRPGLQAEIIRKANHPSIKASFDNGHALIFSSLPAADWIETLGADLHHCHLHDNNGELDQHLAVGTGKEDWKNLISALQNDAPNAVLVAESDHLQANKASIDNLRRLLNRVDP
jgi:sugar phosphate isomerase/epimerase